MSLLSNLDFETNKKPRSQGGVSYFLEDVLIWCATFEGSHCDRPTFSDSN